MARSTIAASMLVASVALVSACGSSATKSLSAPAAALSASAAVSAAASAAPADSAAAVPTAAPTTAPAAGDTAGVSSTPGTGSDAGSKFCQIAIAEQAQSKDLTNELTSGNTDAIKAYIQKAIAALPAFAAAAPSSIKADVESLVTVDNKLFGALKANNYDFAKSASAVTAAISDPSFAAAGQHVAAYLTNSCGVAATFPSAGATG